MIIRVIGGETLHSAKNGAALPGWPPLSAGTSSNYARESKCAAIGECHSKLCPEFADLSPFQDGEAGAQPLVYGKNIRSYVRILRRDNWNAESRQGN